MDLTVDPAQIIVAFTGILALLLARGQKKKSEDRQDRIQSARSELDRREVERKEALDVGARQDRLIDSLQEQHDRDQAEKAQLRAECEQRLTEAYDRHRRDLERERAGRDAERQICRREVQHMHEELMAAAGSLRSEVDASAVRDAAKRGETHLLVDHDDESTD